MKQFGLVCLVLLAIVLSHPGGAAARDSALYEPIDLASMSMWTMGGAAPGDQAPIGLDRPYRPPANGMLVAGLIVQGLGVSLAVAGVIEPTIEMAQAIYHLATFPFSIITIAGFCEQFSDGTESGRFRAVGMGFVEGAIYGFIVAGLGIAQHAHHNWRMSQFCSQPGVMCEGPSGLANMVSAIAHGGFGLTMLIPGIALMTSAPGAGKAPEAQLLVAPFRSGDASGLALSGRF